MRGLSQKPNPKAEAVVFKRADDSFYNILTRANSWKALIDLYFYFYFKPNLFQTSFVVKNLVKIQSYTMSNHFLDLLMILSLIDHDLNHVQHDVISSGG